MVLERGYTQGFTVFFILPQNCINITESFSANNIKLQLLTKEIPDLHEK